ncbi:hypothetical protein QQG74_14885 [Micromonospora sp. FIMYZ51]|uniref:hypothetical protein n=1 Tax=Micromonospora sp. FIMYZ51 TaxID=3051832 RepID=UPI00311E9CD6
MGRRVWWAAILVALSVGLLAGLRLGWLDWVVAEQHPVRNALAVIGGLVGAVGAVYPLIQGRRDRRDGRRTDLLDSLALAMTRRWKEEAELRGLRHGALPIRWRLAERKVAPGIRAALAIGAQARFAPLPGLHRVTGAALRDGGGLRDLYRVYGGLASGRVLLTGEGASGKTATGVLLLLTALQARAKAADHERPDIPVPVLLELRDWRVPDESVADWAARALAQSERLVRDRTGRQWVKQMLQDGRIALFLDGFDEVDAAVRHVMVRELNKAPFRLVVFSRPQAAVQTASRHPLSGALGLALQPVTAKEAASYLRRRDLPDPPPQAWRAVLEDLEGGPGGPLTKALRYPLAVSLLRDAYTDHDPVDELLDRERFPTVQAVHHHLLDQAVRTAYGPTQRHCRYSAATAERTLRFLARRLVEAKTYDLAWWHIPSWVPPNPGDWTAGLVAGVVSGTVATAVHGLRLGLTIGFTIMAAVVLFMSRRRAAQPLETTGWREIFNRTTLRYGLAVGGINLVGILLVHGDSATGVGYAVFCAILGTLTTAVFFSPASDIVAAIPHMSAALMLGVRPERLWQPGERPPRSAIRAVGPKEMWRHHAYGRLALGVAFGGALGVWFTLITLVGDAADPKAALLAGLPVAVAFGLVCGPATNMAVLAGMSMVQLRLTEGTPVRLLSFLEDARRRNLIRVVGQVYQFRHADLRDRLASRAG